MAKTVDEKKIIYTMERVSRSYGTKVVLKDISISYYYGAKIGVVGENGAGKSSLFKILAGVDKEFAGETHVSPGYTLGYLEQEPVLEAGKTVKEIVMEGVKPITDLLAEFDKVNEEFGNPDADFEKLCARQAELQEKLEAADAWNLDANLELAMDALRCPPGDQVVDVLSGGERRRVALCRLLLQQPDILLLDEPTNHLDAETVAWLERHLQNYSGTVIAITHDRYFLDNGAKDIRSREIIRHGLRQRKSVLLRKKSRPAYVKSRCRKSLNGFTQEPREGRQSTRNTSPVTSSFWQKKAKGFSSGIHRFQFRRVHVLETS